ncbi:uncharacterized protein LOC115090676 [Rhinatrema bivittatum]|uniref:uncharacterized protein LOC115090676 n=1 Tax=Rhinatrema bivittatum TaxID=194408 RepID=UPI00112DE0FE|nr:uncharacterized protein LOC115090676 [Rhinatrema bivittatum]
MGATMAPTIANLFMTEFEQEWIHHSPFVSKIVFYKRYIDDIFILWSGTEQELHLFEKWINTCDENIQFVLNYNFVEISFLDVSLKKMEDGAIVTTVFKKSTDRNTMLHFDSAHPMPLKNSLPFSQFLRYKRNCSNTTVYRQQSEKLKLDLKNRGYPNKCIKTGFKRALYYDRDALLTPQPKSQDENMITCVTQYSPWSRKIIQAMRHHWFLIKMIPGMQDIEFRAAYSRSQNLKEILSPSTLKDVEHSQTIDGTTPLGHFRCGHCKICDQTLELKEYICTQTQYRYRMYNFTTCQTDHVIYIIRCPCNKIYVGQTTRSFKLRIGEHKSCLKNKKLSAPIVLHCIQKNHDVKELRWFVLEHVKRDIRGGDRERSLYKKEQEWIFKLKSEEPDGLNSKIEWNSLIH